MKAIQIVGRKKSGKTSLVVRLLPLLRAHGLRLATVKHSGHPHALDREGSDSWLHRQAGAEATLAVTAAAVSFHFDIPETEDRTQALVERYLGEHDLVLIEGWAGRAGAKIEVVPAGKDGRAKMPRFLDGGELLAVVLAPGLRPSPEDVAPWGELQPAGAWAPAAAGSALTDAAGAKAAPDAGGAKAAPDAGGGGPIGAGPARRSAGAPVPCFLWEDAVAVARFILDRHES
ncbi:MAG: molybdopterin-guanine dinucleotide biosynthesis protein B [Candidatus Eisenbacteria bacterium]|uniref:Molybdopterin-guanine dinucleotide biosynthesis protein B n=1 Tax=Eiseniibacteriota bacterium TaxID=2212470 RepID=A0A937X9W8_UNCEI|nr:molybdopterin-guanine dinucleotide biosynthesis protein B [Candidatus Eisenbacteria bacterium]